MIPIFAISFILKLSNEYGILESVISSYNDAVWKDCIMSMKVLGHKILDETKYNIKLINRSDYKELLLPAGDLEIMLLILASDDGKDYNVNVLHDNTSYNSKVIEDRIRYFNSTFSCISQNIKLYTTVVGNFFDRSIGFGIDINIPKLIHLRPFQLNCLSINERNHTLILLHYIDAKTNLNFFSNPFINDYNIIALYVENDYSFYMDDDNNLSEITIYIELGDDLNYTNKALKTENRQLLEYPGTTYLKEVIINDSLRNIYVPTKTNKLELLLKYTKLQIWITSNKANSITELNIYHSIVDLLSYWLSEIKNVIENSFFITNNIVIQNDLKGNIEHYNQEYTDDSPLGTLILLKRNTDNLITIEWTPESYAQVCNRGSDGEKDLLYLLINKISELTYDGHIECDLNYFFTSPLKHRMIMLNYGSFPYLKPINHQYTIIPKESIDVVLDKIGHHFIDKQKNNEANDSDKKSDFCKEIVSFLYAELEKQLGIFDVRSLIMHAYSDLESTMYSIMLFQIQYSINISCYPEKKQKYDEEFNELNKSSMALKFLIEYVGAVHLNGKTPIGSLDYEYLLALCIQIIDWAHTGDLFHYNIIDDDIRLLNSGRIGYNKKRIEYLSHKSGAVNSKRLLSISNPNIKQFNHNKFIEDKLPELDRAFVDEYGYSFSEYKECILCMIRIGEELKTEVKEYDQNKLTERISKECKVAIVTINRILSNISLFKRNEFLTVPAPFKQGDVFPWRHNRRLSFVRRPLVNYNNSIIWGNRQLYHSFRFTIDLITNGKLEVCSKSMKQLISKIANNCGNSFNYEVANRIRELGFEKVYSKVMKVNKKRIEDERGATLGDIDILLINETKRRIIVIEVKDFSYSKTPYEIHNEYTNLFCDTEKKKCYITKHKRRVEWVKTHIDDIIKQYDLTCKNWKVSDVLIVSEPIISKSYYHKNQKILIYSELDKQSLNNI